ncbi:MAG: putative endonuclease 4, partial [Thermoleophilia bacterium]|nr:putative endonuclease 4 [Thermoleophilia bacterium]
AVRANSLMALRATMETARGLGADAVVFHVGSHLGYGFDEAVDVVAPALRDLLELTTDELWLCMENAAGAGGTIGRSIAELAALCDAVEGHPRLGICLDSCHWWASGVDVSDRALLAEALEDLDTRMGLERLRILHVNDSKTPLASNRDRHELVGRGLMGDGLATFLGHPAFQSLPAIVETWEDKGRETEDLDRMRALRRKGRRRWASRA